jgi:uncharacterized protein
MSEDLRNKLNEAVKLLVEACHPTRIILFGSYAQGSQKDDSDIDILVVEKNVVSSAEEIVRLCRILSPLQLAIDLVVVDEATFAYWADTPGTVHHEAFTDGQTLYEAA